MVPNSLDTGAPSAVIPGPSTRERLVVAAAQELSQRGGIDLTVASVARAAGMTTGAVYSCFVNREELVAAAFIHRIDRRSGNLDLDLAHVAADVFSTEPPDADRLWEIAGRLSTPSNTHERLLTLHTLVSARHSQILRAQLLPVSEVMWNNIAVHITASQQAGVTRADLSALEMASAWTAALLGVAPMAQLLWDRGRMPEIELEQQKALFIIMQCFATSPYDVPRSARRRHAIHARGRGGRHRAARDSQTRRALISAAIEAQDRLGTYELKVADIARTAGVTTGALYAEFGDRAGLMAEAHLERLRVMQDAPTNHYDYAAIIFSTEPEDEATSIAFATQIVRPEVRVRRIQALEAFVGASFNPVLRDELLRRSDSVLGPIVDAVARSQRAGQTRDDMSATSIAWAWMGCSQGLSAWAMLAAPASAAAAARLYSVNSVVMRAFKVQRWTRVMTPEDLDLHD
jgi:AcrR family transcriptional regulator